MPIVEVKERPTLPRYSAKSVRARKRRFSKLVTPNTSYGEMIRIAVRMKWPEPEMKEWWYSLLSAARRKKTTILFERQNGKCVFCKQDTWLSERDRNGRSPRKMATLEHVDPQSNGGSDSLTNVVMSCNACNSLRGNMDYEKFMNLREDPERWKAYCKRLSKAKSDKAKQVSEKKQIKRSIMVGRLVIFKHYYPEYFAYLQQIVREQVAIIEARRLASLERMMIDPVDIQVDNQAISAKLISKQKEIDCAG